MPARRAAPVPATIFLRKIMRLRQVPVPPLGFFAEKSQQ
jgi:hypothetical protein